MKRKRIKLHPAIRIFSVSEESDGPTQPAKLTKRDNSKETIPRSPSKVESRVQFVEPYSFCGAVWKTYGEYCNESSIHGVPYLHHQRQLKEKLFWLILLFISLFLCITQIKIQYDRWNTTPVIISFSEVPTPVSQIPFPAITICSETKSVKNDRINFTRFFHYIHNFVDKSEIVEPPPWLTADEYLKMRALLQVCGNFLVDGIKFPEYPPLAVTDHLNQIAPAFTQSLLFCSFNQTLGGCTPFFEKIYTEEGICYTFNALNESELYREDTHQYQYFEKDKHVRKRIPTLDWSIDNGYEQEDDYDTYPIRVIGCGLRAGLLVALRGSEENLDFICRGPVQGFKLILHSPDDIPQVDKHFIHVPYERDILVLIKPHLVLTTDEIEDYAPKRRNCYYPEERYLQFFRFYTQNNCEIECLANFTLKHCGCVQFSHPRLPQTVVCDASKISCLDKAENDFLRSEFTGLGNADEKCNCLPGCFTLSYDHEVSQGVFNMESVLQAYNFGEFMEDFEDTQMSRIQVYFKDNEFTAWKRSELYGITDFLANCGGLFGLFMGVSALSVVELVYHFTVRLYKNVHEMQLDQNN